MDLSKATDAQLKAELERRNLPKNVRPQQNPNPDFTQLIRMLDEMVDTAIERGFWDEDNKHYIYEVVMSAVYGPNYYGWPFDA